MTPDFWPELLACANFPECALFWAEHGLDKNLLNTGIAANRISSAKYGFISVVNLKALDWTYYSIPHSLGSVPEFILLTPMTMNAGRFAWKVTALTDTTINIDIYNWESSGYSVAFYYLITK